MGRRKQRRRLEPFEVEIERLGVKGLGFGVAPDGAPVGVKPAPVGSRLRVVPTGKRKGRWQARRLEMVRKPDAWVEPPCEAFGICGGCILQEMALEAQRLEKEKYALGEVAEPRGWSLEELREKLEVIDVRGSARAYGYRNKVELSFGVRRFLSREALDAGEPIEGRWLGFHAAGRFDRVADVETCHLIGTDANQLLAFLRGAVLQEGQAPLWDVRTHEGFWRHAMLRQAEKTKEHVVALYTTSAQSDAQRQEVTRVAEGLMALELEDDAQVVGVVWLANDGVADVARGEVQQIWGREWMEERLGSVSYRLSYRSFFQTSTSGAEVLYETIREALAGASSAGTLVDLYCGIGAIGLYLAEDFARILGIEEVAEAVEDAQENARLNGVTEARFIHAKVEDALHELPDDDALALIVDPPRAGLHPRVARALANTHAETLLYVACHPGSLGRDALLLEQGGWKLQTLWTVDLFPQTGHIELIGRFSR